MKKVVLITGGSRGIGVSCVRRFASEGWQVVFTYHKSEEKAKKLAEETNSICLKADVTSLEEMMGVKVFLEKTFGKLDALVVNAGVDVVAPFVDLTEKDYDYVINTNLKGAFNSVKVAEEFMLKQMSGKIVFVSSVWGLCGASCESVYSASKSAVLGLMSSLAKEFGPMNINVNAVAPGYIETDMNSHLSIEEKQDVINQIPLSRVGTPQDVANSVFFLCSENASYISNTTLKVDGGWI